MSCIRGLVTERSKADLLKLIKRMKKRGVSVRMIAEQKLARGHYAAWLQVCQPSSPKRVSRADKERAVSDLKKWFA